MRRLRKPHEHQFTKAAAVRVEEDPHTGLPVTQALAHCECGRPEVWVLPGQWTLEQVRGLSGD